MDNKKKETKEIKKSEVKQKNPESDLGELKETLTKTNEYINKNKKRSYTTHEAAKLLYVTSTTIIQWIKNGKIKSMSTMGGHRRIKAEIIDELVKKMES